MARRLDGALEAARRVLEPHTAHLEPGLLDCLAGLRVDLEAVRIRIALYGEVKAGKSTLLNALAGATLSPVAFEPLTSIPVRVTYGPAASWSAAGNRLDSLAEVERLLRNGGAGIDELVVETPYDLLRFGGRVELVDTPGVGGRDELGVVADDVVESLDAVVFVVRYPALFTRATRALVEKLAPEIAKIFFVWNLDAACTGLTPEQQSFHADALRTEVAGEHALFLVDAQKGFEAARRGDEALERSSGLSALRSALRDFASSSQRQASTIREISKRAAPQLRAAGNALTERRDTLENAVRQTRERLDAVRAAAAEQSEAVRKKAATVESEVETVARTHRDTGQKLARDLRRQVRAARRRWVRHADGDATATQLNILAGAYADRVAEACRGATEALGRQLQEFDTTVEWTQRQRLVPDGGALSSGERQQRARSGRLRMLRRALWRNWYLPGLKALESDALRGDLAAQDSWLGTEVQRALSAVRTTLSERLAAIANRAEGDLTEIAASDRLSENEAELGTLQATIPAVTAAIEAVEDVKNRARQAID